MHQPAQPVDIDIRATDNNRFSSLQTGFSELRDIFPDSLLPSPVSFGMFVSGGERHHK